MNEIEKLYKNAGLSDTWVERYDDKEIWHKSYNEMISTMMRLNDWTRQIAIDIAKKECKKEYPPFTAEKQLELIKQICPSYPLNYHIRCFQGYTFEEGLAKCINDLWQDLTEEERKQIKEILNG